MLTDSRAEPLSIMGVLGDNGDLFRETCITLYLDSLKVMKLEVAQVWIIFIIFISLCRTVKSPSDDTGQYKSIFIISKEHNLRVLRDIKAS